MNIKELVNNQREYYLNGYTLSYEARKVALELLEASIKKYEDEILESLEKDLGKHRIEGYFSEVGQVYKELSYMKKNLKKFMKKKNVKSELSDFPSRSFVSSHPYGVTCVISPWNYPFLLAIGPVIGAIAAGNTVMIKPSEFSIHTTNIIEKIMDVFEDTFVCVIKGAVKETTELLDQKLDYIFFTGSTMVGKIVMEKASKHLTPISLELGGKSPTIVDQTANIKVAAKRIAFGKHLNAGQTCIAPDYVFLHKDIKEEFIRYYVKSIEELYGKEPMTSIHYGKIINQKHYDRLKNLMDEGEAIYGGIVDDTLRVIHPTVIHKLPEDSKIMNEEIFGPLLPVLEYETLEDVVAYINSKATPLALYLFTESKDVENEILSRCNFGGGCINDTIVQAGSHYLPFGGVGESGIGAYHGKNTFETFTHYRSIIKKSTKIDLQTRYAPYTEKQDKLIRRLLK